MHGHRFKIYTLISEIHENVDLAQGIKNIFRVRKYYKFMRLLFQFPE